MKDLVGGVGAAGVCQTGDEYALGKPVGSAVGAAAAGGQGAVTVQQGDLADASADHIDVNVLVDLDAHDATGEVGRAGDRPDFDRP
ncbi:MAG: hypothetical protein EBR30_30660 [Cytophagia bacterium]|uniref:Uncharacterized protein n=1 Tax=Candidatus Fonsibacter lacus TaxID=2576439 RepID=A0A964XRX2_9PROT|nr:hypothetical protein [Candidatus Fonsibacter lacus]NBW39307.1 hypothetical protein [Cytophagia bacterium]NCU72634.1 hypothetical protein [Candidatus Fonsibacter lacus]